MNILWQCLLEMYKMVYLTRTYSFRQQIWIASGSNSLLNSLGETLKSCQINRLTQPVRRTGSVVSQTDSDNLTGSKNGRNAMRSPRKYWHKQNEMNSWMRTRIRIRQVDTKNGDNGWFAGCFGNVAVERIEETMRARDLGTRLDGDSIKRRSDWPRQVANWTGWYVF